MRRSPLMLAAVLHLDEAIGATVNDASGKGLSGTTSGTTSSVDTGYSAAMCL